MSEADNIKIYSRNLAFTATKLQRDEIYSVCLRRIKNLNNKLERKDCEKVLNYFDNHRLLNINDKSNRYCSNCFKILGLYSKKCPICNGDVNSIELFSYYILLSISLISNSIDQKLVEHAFGEKYLDFTYEMNNDDAENLEKDFEEKFTK